MSSLVTLLRFFVLNKVLFCFHFLSFDIRSCVCGSCLWVVLLMKWAIWVVLGLCFGGGILLFEDVVEFCYWNVWPVNRLLFKLQFCFGNLFIWNAWSQLVSDDILSIFFLLVVIVFLLLIKHFLYGSGVKSQLDYLQQCLPGNFFLWWFTSEFQICTDSWSIWMYY